MPYLRKLPSGKWQATVRGPGNKRFTKTDPLKSVVKQWGLRKETEFARDEWIDPDAQKITFGEWHAKWWAARVVESIETKRTDEGCFRNHILPQWNAWRVRKIKRLDVQTWIRDMEQRGVGAAMIKRCFGLFATAMWAAAREELINAPPTAKIDLPDTSPKAPAWFTREQIDLIKDELPHRHAVMTELMVMSGPRWGEAAGLRGTAIDWTRSTAMIHGTLTQGGRWKDLPKTTRSRREIPLPRYLLAQLGELMEGRPQESYVFTTVRSNRPFVGSNWRKVWYEAIEAANDELLSEGKELIPRYRPHDCRHTCASWLVQAGVPLYDIQKLLGHESYVTTQRYAHLAPDAHGAVEAAWDKLRDAQQTHAPG